MDVPVDGETLNCYELCVDQNDTMYPVISSSIPNDLKIYERQARIALRRYIGNRPETIVSSWY